MASSVVLGAGPSAIPSSFVGRRLKASRGPFCSAYSTFSRRSCGGVSIHRIETRGPSSLSRRRGLFLLDSLEQESPFPASIVGSRRKIFERMPKMRVVSDVVSHFARYPSFLSPLIESIALRSMMTLRIDQVCALASRAGRGLQRYDEGCRQVVGCIPYRYKNTKESSFINGTVEEDIEVLVISPKKGQGLLFPKGGWETDEDIEEAALRETIEEAGVTGDLEDELGKWQYESKRDGVVHRGCMFALLVKQEFDVWPESNVRTRKWVAVSEAREACRSWWMREALDEFSCRKSRMPNESRGCSDE